MLDLKFIAENSELVKTSVANKNEKADIDRLLVLNNHRKEIIGQVEKKKAERNMTTGEIAKLKKAGEDATEVIAAMKALGKDISDLDNKQREIETELNEILLTVPNIPDPSTPVGKSEDDNVEIKNWGELPKFNFTPAPHWELGEKLGLFDLEAGAKLSGSGFILYTGLGAKLERALINFMLDLHTEKHGYKEIFPPFLVTRQTMMGTGQIPKLEDDMYSMEDGEMFLIPTAEVPLTNIDSETIFKEEDMPRYYCAYTPCFRREAGSHGKDTRGLIRVHQFNKVEMVRIVPQNDSAEELEILLDQAEEVLRLLNIPYRVRTLCTGDLSFAASKCYDIEAYAAGVDKYLEVSSCSTYTDFQARRMKLRYRPKDGGKPLFCHTLNGSGLATPRTMIAILENFQTEKGTIIIPEPLRPYMGGMEEIK
jgi:seryl-tRNA synthetase